MRISTHTMYDVNVSLMNQAQARLLHTQLQVSSGRRILSPSDDPAAAARALQVTQADASNTQYGKNLTIAQNTLSQSETVLSSVTSVIQDLQTTVITAGGPSVTNTDRQAMAKVLQGSLNQLLGLANSTDAQGNYLFSGFQGRTPPFVSTASGMQYQGDDGQRLIQVGATRQMAASESGADIFMRIRSGNGTFVIQPAAANIGSGIASKGSVSDPTALTGDSYQVTFTSATTFDVTDTTTGATVSTGNPYTSGQSISFDGMNFSIEGTPATGDKFALAPSTNESLFQTLSNLINVLNTPVAAGDAAGAARLQDGLNKAMNGFTRGLDSVLSVRASLGARLNELDAQQVIGTDLGLQYKQTLSQLQDVDYNQAITDLTQQQTILQAAQKSFAQISQLSMFDYLK